MGWPFFIGEQTGGGRVRTAGSSWGGGSAAAVTAILQLGAWTAEAGRAREGQAGPTSSHMFIAVLTHDTDLRHPASTDFRRAGHLHGARPVTFHKGSQHAQQPQEVEPQKKANLPFTTPTTG